MPESSSYWPRAILFVDMDAFFASIEELDFPELCGRPLGITNGEQGTCIITCSYAARRRGIYTGMRVTDARALCPDFIQRPARPQRYAQVSQMISQSLHEAISPDLEVFSVDEVFMDITHCQRLFGSVEQIAQRTKQLIDDIIGLPCSIGVSGDKTTAKYLAKANKPNGLGIVAPNEARAFLHDVPVTKLCGIGAGIGRFLGARGVHRCGDMARLPVGVLGKRFGNIGRRIWKMCLGEDPEKVHVTVGAPKSIGHGKVMPPQTRERRTVLTYLSHMSEKVAARLRKHQLLAQQFSIALLSKQGWLGDNYKSVISSDDGKVIFQLAQQMLDDCWLGEGVSQVSICALDPRPNQGQQELFAEPLATADTARNQAMDLINQRYGEFTLAPARLLDRSSMPNVISPAWKPDGVRQSI